MGGAIQADEETRRGRAGRGGAQIEYQDEDRAIHRIFEGELARNGAPCHMKSMVDWCTAE